MNAITPAGSGFHPPSQAYGDFTSTSASRTGVSYSQASDIVIQTLEGDTVTLSSSTYNAGGYETYESLAIGKGGFAHRYGETAYFESRQQMSVSVTGDLNQEELEDINRILSTLDEMMRDLTTGNLGNALSRGSQFVDIDSIGSFSADLNITATLATSRLETMSTSAFKHGTWGEEGDEAALINQMADTISNALKPRTALIEYLVPKIDDFFSDWFDTASIESSNQTKGSTWGQHFAQRLTDGLKPGMSLEGDL